MWDEYWAADVLYLHSLLHPNTGCSVTYSLSVLLANRFIITSLLSTLSLQTSTQKNILETVETMKTEKTAKPRGYFWGGSGVCLFWVFWRRKAISEAERSWQCGKHTERHCGRKTELSVRKAFQHDCVPFNSYSKRKTTDKTSSERQ